MAIKKGAFEQYTQERKLPEKRQNNQIKAKHFFDNIDLDREENGSQLVHNDNSDNLLIIPNFDTIANIDKSSIETDESLKVNLNNKNQIIINTELINSDIGSRTVHERFTNQNLVSKPEQEKIEITSQKHLDSNSKISFSNLIGNQREIIIALYKNMRLNRTETTEELNLEMIANLTGVNQKSLKNTIFRLSSAGFLSRVEQKNGRGGWVKYKINEKIIAEIQNKGLFKKNKGF